MKLFGNPVPWQSHDRLGPDAREAVRIAEAGAASRGARQAIPDDVLLALLAAPEGVVCRALAGLGVDLDSLKKTINQALQHGPAGPGLPEPAPLDAAAREAVLLGLNEARRAGFVQAGTGHLLLGILEERSGAGARLLARQGVEIKVLRDVAERLQDSAEDRDAGMFAAAFGGLLHDLGAGLDCSQCGAPLHGSFRYCYSCGSPVGESRELERE